MKITLLGSLGNINREYIPRLVAAGHDLTVITSSEKRVPDIEKLGCKAAVGSMRDVDFLTQTFTGSDLVYLMISGNPAQATDIYTMAEQQAAVFKTALIKSGVKNVVNLSSIGAQTVDAGALYAYHFIEDALNSLLEVNVALIRPVGFYTNLFADLPTLKTQQTIYSALPADILRAFVAPSDIADVIFEKITAMPTGHTMQYVVSDWFTTAEWLENLSKNGISATLQLITPEQVRENYRSFGMSDRQAELYTQMTLKQLTPDALYDEIKASDYHLGKIKGTDFAKVFAAVLKGQE